MTRLLELWQPPDEAGPAVGCFATSFTFEADFFVEDCRPGGASGWTAIGDAPHGGPPSGNFFSSR